MSACLSMPSSLGVVSSNINAYLLHTPRTCCTKTVRSVCLPARKSAYPTVLRREVLACPYEVTCVSGVLSDDVGRQVELQVLNQCADENSKSGKGKSS